MFGDSLTRLFRFEGFAADVHYYVNDIGRQIGLLVLHAENFDAMSFDEILDAYVAANAERTPRFGERLEPGQIALWLDLQPFKHSVAQSDFQRRDMHR